MVGHLLVYHPGVDKLKAIADSGELGDIHYIYSHRLNLGTAAQRRERAVVARRARHLGDPAPRRTRTRTSSRRAARPTCARASRTSCSRSCASRPASPRTCTCPGWTRTRRAASPSSARKRMATFDDMELERKVTVYDKGFDEDTQLLRRVHHPLGRHPQPADLQPRAAADRVRALLECIREGTTPRSDGEAGLRVVRVLDALQRSLDDSQRMSDASA